MYTNDNCTLVQFECSLELELRSKQLCAILFSTSLQALLAYPIPSMYLLLILSFI